LITGGGLPVRRTTLISGTAGSAKTVVAVQFLAAGMHIGKSFRNMTGILSGNPRQFSPDELDRLGGLFHE
jgi:hypothetical protein